MIREGKVKKGGCNEEPSIFPPSDPPRGQGEKNIKLNMSIKNLEFTCKKFNKDNLLFISIPDILTMEEIDNLKDEMRTSGINPNTFIVPNSFDIKKIEFVGIDDKKVDKINMKDDTIQIVFIDKN